MRYSVCKNDHHTGMYNFDTPIFRRGIPFSLNIYSGQSKEIIKCYSYSLELEGQKCMSIRLIKCREVSGWKYDISEHCGIEKYRIDLYPSTSVPIGLYILHVTYQGRVVMRKKFVIFFNPWDCNDTVYMENQKLLEEYINSTTTTIYLGTKASIIEKRWKLDQFDRDSVRVALNLLNRMSYEERRDPILVSRSLSALVNSNDDNGILSGNWSGNYGAGTNPSYWTRSGDILSEYASTNRPVRYGQCWVFSAVLCTVLRTVGIPTRCITCFASFHDADNTLNWEVYVDENLNVMDKGRDTLWNFHCWNESWMKRHDLGSQFNGWQVLDATPQERSRGLYRLGPAPKYAIQNGITNRQYDIGFVFAEVNAQKIYYMRQPDGRFKQYKVERDEVGKKISTKMVGVDCREDITLEYKPHGRTEIDRIGGPRLEEARRIECGRHRKIEIKFCLPKSVCITEGLHGSVTISGMNNGKGTKVKRELTLVTYRGKLITELSDTTSSCLGTMETFPLNINAGNLASVVKVEFPYIRCKVSVYDPQHDEFTTKEKIVSIITPDVEIVKLRKVYCLHSTIKMKVSVKNLLDRDLTCLYLKIHFTDYIPPLIHIGRLEPRKTSVHTVILNAHSIGMKKVTVGQISKECSGFACTESFLVIP